MMLLGIFAIVVASLLGASGLLLTWRLRGYVHGYQPTTNAEDVGVVAVIVPCKGLDAGFEHNIRAVLAQDYPQLRFVFVTATDDDPACGALHELLSGDTGCRAELITAGLSPKRAQKLTNQLAAVGHVGKEAEVLVFLDSDIRPRTDFVSQLVAPLANAAVGASSGFRFYVPQRGGLGSYLRAIWNAGGIPFLVDQRHNYAWGGAMAIRRETFEACAVARHWDRAVSDDFGLTRAVKEGGYVVEFVPKCLAVSAEDATLAQAVEWTTRQTTIAKVYSPRFWWTVAVVHGLLNLFVLGGFGLLAHGLWSGNHAALAWGLGLLSPIVLEWLNGLWLLRAVVQMLGQEGEAVRPKVWRYILPLPLASALLLYNTIRSAMTNRIAWRGVTYEMRSPADTRIV